MNRASERVVCGFRIVYARDGSIRAIAKEGSKTWFERGDELVVTRNLRAIKTSEGERGVLHRIFCPDSSEVSRRALLVRFPHRRGAAYQSQFLTLDELAPTGDHALRERIFGES